MSLAGRNTRLQGLAAAILKLWEKSLIAKIAVKVGVQNTNNEQVAWNLKASIIPDEVTSDICVIKVRCSQFL